MGILLFLFYFMVLRIVSFNARGLLNGLKFEKVKELCKNDDMILLQETNWKGNVIEDFKSRWEGEIFFSNEEKSLGVGVAILIKKRESYYDKTNV